MDSVDKYSAKKPDFIPNIDEILISSDYEKAKNKSENSLKHRMNINQQIKEWIIEINQKYDK